MGNKLIIAAAGSGKTTTLVRDALSQIQKVLITTFTKANEQEIRKKIIEINGCIPENIIVQTWFAFLLKHGVRPFQGKLIGKKVRGLILVNGGSVPYTNESTQFEKHYFSNEMKIYSDKISKFVVKSEEKSSGALFDRLSRIYSKIYIDEVQDLSGYDLEILKLLFASTSDIILVGDPRQGTYSTNNSSKNKRFQKSQILHFFEDRFDIETDDKSLVVNHRCIKDICDLSNKLFPHLNATTSGNQNTTEHDGVFFIKEKDVAAYLAKYNPVQLRDSRRTKVDESYNSINFGESKGLSFERILIYPTKPVIDWLLNNNESEFAPTSRAKFYVALTRARQSVGIVYNYTDTQIEGITKFSL